jgi:hypothetical protein
MSFPSCSKRRPRCSGPSCEMTRLGLAVLCGLLAYSCSGCATVPERPWTVSDPKDRTGWESRPMCYNLCRSPGGFMVIRWERKF